MNLVRMSACVSGYWPQRLRFECSCALMQDTLTWVRATGTEV